ncbi:S-adenosyl-L-methionine-dependent methyltransferase [Tirmania nivea]|nr:S-adenosyl-L-methionine-dependent methyltransferase [Tirmania nivea]
MKPRISTAQLRNCSRMLRVPLRPVVGIPSWPLVWFNSSSTTPAPNPNDGTAKQAPTALVSGKAASAPPSSPAPPSLEKQLVDIIKMSGPIPLALYMKQCLTSSTHGYYTTPRPNPNPPTATPPDPFGATGDFITSPEISQMFGEMLGIWILTEWLGQGRRREGVVLMELGPGRGTLMADVLRTLEAFPDMRSAVEKVVLLEASPGLRETQARMLCGDGEGDGGLRRTEVGNGWWGRVKAELGGGRVEWYEDWELVPKDTSKSPYILAHEFFDALPIHAFQATPSGWRELLVTHRSLSPPHPSPITLTSSTSTSTSKPLTSTSQDPFHLILSPTPTPYSQLLPTLSPRHAPLLTLSRTTTTSAPPTIEISPLSLALLTSLSRTLSSSPSGALLIIDYGPSNHTPSNTLRGIRSHKLVSPFSHPGDVDLSADVDFLALAETAVAAPEGVEVHGPVEQGVFLAEMGMRERMEVLVKAGAGDEDGRRVRGAFERLVGRETGGMGRIYKALAVVKERGGRRPVGFGGVVVGGEK